VLQAALDGLALIATWDTLLVMIIGIVLGIVIGILPGVGGVVGLAAVIPFTFDLPAHQAIVLLLTLATVNSTAGDFTSIIFGIPGDGASSALVVDGHPMAKRGEGGRALSGNLLASTVGALFGAVALILAIPFVTPIVLSFGSPEFLMLTVLGLAFVGHVSGGRPLRGLVSGLIGLSISFIGLAPGTGAPRFTFGSLSLWEGVGVAAVALGLFAIPELLQLMNSRKGYRSDGITEAKMEGVRRGLVDVWVHRWLVLRCSAIGTGIGLLPGMGGATSQWMAYGHAVQSSPNKERFGKGAVEGCLGPGAANNSGLGGSLVPTVAFGIPGNVITALILGALIIHGIAPGPAMLTDDLDLTLSFAWTVIIAQVLTFVVLFPFIRHTVKLGSMRTSILVPVLTVAVFFGAYLEGGGQLFSLGVTLMVGLLAVTLVQLDWPRAPLILGLVLGPLMERYLNLSYSRYGFNFLERPIVIGIMVLCLLVAFQPLLKRVMRRRRAARVAAGDADSGGATPVSGVVVGSRGEAAAFATVFVLGCYIIWSADEWAPSMALLPRSVGIGMVLLAGAGLLFELSALRRMKTPPVGSGDEILASTSSAAQPEAHHPMSSQSVATASVATASVATQPVERSAELAHGEMKLWHLTWLGVAFAAVATLGFVVASPLLTVAYARFVSKESWRLSLGTAIAVGLVVWQVAAAINLPVGAGLFGIPLA
jgi:putative tricarboxylic transport membrane protein